ncbi:D-serine deaminase-like pyridoxal phosphate-dependent protein [Thermosporothrix hazakensis]|jgi:D-serine deaminase-like pyridoxal phosphate-dependent protein|uniref:D-serine deaminase-like pyridoxal phosphate-dependent protein n=1 Tax=Thermosporothrix hazakensis TaxID=644383 RepID=A0A326UKA7_THEHA|nr:alanine racemase [Thermosporothrix hazakensis]PZW29397.1 D-serine deaminase-like pyridoxal phosphate-dependent protein [Thermosporothrix hazakensis]GCE45888.1 alanine racemase [Thermosporothrix hazakensis]
MTLIGQPIENVDTPSLLVDDEKLQANIERFARIARNAQVKLRPHIKTHKIPAIAARQLQAGAVGITAAKLSEAEVFIDSGIGDVFVAYPIVGAMKARHAAHLAKKCRLIVGADSAAGIQHLSKAACEAGVTLFVRIEINSGLNRSGIQPERAASLCRLVLDAPGLELDGIFTFRGISFPDAPSQEAEVLGRLEGELMVDLANCLRADGIPINEVSVGSTPSGEYAARVSGVTEIRPGTYVFFDRMTMQSGTSTLDEIALSILTTVVSRPAPDIAIIDAGAKAFSGDVIPQNAGLQGYGVTTDGVSGIVIKMSEEHGFVKLAPGFQPEIGEKLAFFPNHVCTSVNLSNELLLVREGKVTEVLPVAARGLRQ